MHFFFLVLMVLPSSPLFCPNQFSMFDFIIMTHALFAPLYGRKLKIFHLSSYWNRACIRRLLHTINSTYVQNTKWKRKREKIFLATKHDTNEKSEQSSHIEYEKSTVHSECGAIGNKKNYYYRKTRINDGRNFWFIEEKNIFFWFHQ